MNSGVLITNLVEKIEVEGNNYGLDSICLITAGIAALLRRIPTLRMRAQSLFETLGRRIGELSLQLKPRHVASLVYSFANVSRDKRLATYQ